MERRPSPSEVRMDELCAIRRPLTEAELEEACKLRVTIRKAAERRRRWANNPDFRKREYDRRIRSQGAQS